VQGQILGLAIMPVGGWGDRELVGHGLEGMGLRSGGGGPQLELGGVAACWGLAVWDGALELRLGCFATPILARNLR
jgi:hypothetical protein